MMALRARSSLNRHVACVSREDIFELVQKEVVRNQECHH